MIKHPLIVVPSLLTLTSVGLNLVFTALLAFPFEWVWNWSVVPLLPCISYWRAVGLLLLWLILRIAGEGVKISAETRSIS